MLSRRFRWVYCQLEVLRHCFPASVRRILDELPKSLDETCERILKEISNANKEHAYRLLQCLVVATRPLRVEELADVLAFDFTSGGTPELNTDWRWEDQEEAVLSACSSLVSVIIDDDSRVVQFSHFSVKEFLTSDRLARSTEEVSVFHIPIEPSHTILAQACLGVLLLDDRDGDDRVKNIPLARYAAEFWVGHARVGDVELQIKDLMDRLFDADKPHFSAWVRIHNLDDWPYYVPFPFHHEKGNALTSLTSASPLYFAALSGLHGQVERLINKYTQQINSQAGRHGTPFHATIYNGHMKVAKLLSQHGADVNAVGGEDKQTPFLLACYRGHLAIAKWLLDCGADVNYQDRDGSTPLHLAALSGHLSIVRLLLARNAEINSRNNGGHTSLLFASSGGHLDVMRLLLDHNADPAHSDDGRTPLQYAAFNGYLDISRILLERSAEVDPRDPHRSTPLLLASEFGRIDVVRLLLDHNADVDARDNDGDTPLLCAASRGHHEVVQLLLDRNAEINARNNDGSTPLHRASMGLPGLQLEGHPEVVQLLLDRGADARSRDLDGATASEVAYGPRRQEIVQLFSTYAKEL